MSEVSEDILSQPDQSVEAPSKVSEHTEPLQPVLKEESDDDKKEPVREGEVEQRTTAEEERLTGKRLH